jgi:hypothetical protein
VDDLAVRINVSGLLIIHSIYLLPEGKNKSGSRSGLDFSEDKLNSHLLERKAEDSVKWTNSKM